ncbi:HAMP domain-containing sensor histidine kinase [Erythrobacter sp. CCH5-A1]|jgi:signal transduction histidine kinase|uniref:sensor histidine kinase n=1 Tax=Erythrobacter sp. CCH5-A1 TaxID=1768792 RepID=UPI00082A0DA9|nr:HAMP domain-containing sensor histidine kinase [Erythrobacter sp. CCH5-A1]
MKRAPSALVSIGGFGIAVAVLSVTATAIIVLAAPPPPATRIVASEAIMALRAETPGFERSIAAAPPSGPRIPMIEGLLAAELGKPDSDLRVTRLDAAPDVALSVRTMPKEEAVRVFGKDLPDTIVLRERDAAKLKVVEPAAATGALRKVLLDLPLPAYAASLSQPDGRWLVVRPAEPFLGGWQRSILIALAVSLLLLAPLAWFFARRLTRPFRALAEALGSDAASIPQEGPRELREAAAAIAAMQQRLAEEANERARMLTAIAHDLRTPLTGLRLRIEAVPEPQRTRMVHDVERMQAMIGEVLNFARDAAAPTALIDVHAALELIVEEMDAGRGMIQLEPGEDAQIRVPEPAFRRAIENLLSNAVTYAGGGTVGIALSQGEVAISVRDEGPGIPETDRERLLRPFERGEGSRNRDTGGAGLGLSIVHNFAAQHAGAFELRDTPGGGTTAILRLPAA